MSLHIVLLGRGYQVSPTNADFSSSRTFIVPYNFKIVFWVPMASNIPDSHALSIAENPRNWYNTHSYAVAYSAGESCCEHILYTDTRSEMFINDSRDTLSFIAPIGQGLLLSDLINRCNLSPHSDNEEVIIHWCADREFCMH